MTPAQPRKSSSPSGYLALLRSSTFLALSNGATKTAHVSTAQGGQPASSSLLSAEEIVLPLPIRLRVVAGFSGTASTPCRSEGSGAMKSVGSMKAPIVRSSGHVPRVSSTGLKRTGIVYRVASRG